MLKAFKKLGVMMLIIITISNSCKHSPDTTVTPVEVKDTTITTPTIPAFTFSTTDNSGIRCSTDSVYFQNDVLPILVSTCAMSGCHDDITKDAGYQLTSYTNVMKKGIVAGNATNSKVYREMGAGMPPAGSGITVSAAQSAMVAKWIQQGAKNNTCNGAYGTCDTTNIKFSTHIVPIIRNQCQGCHMGVLPGGSIRLSTYDEIKPHALSGKLWGSVVHTAGRSPMPKGLPKLNNCDLGKIHAWLRKGAPNN